MAAAEARAGLQRTANRCFIQEDARRAPKISAPTSPSSSKSQSDARPSGTTSSSNHRSSGGIPRHLNPDLQPETKWWLHIQPNFACQKDLMYEQLNSLEAEMDIMGGGSMNQFAKTSGNEKPIQESDAQTHNSAGSFPDQPSKIYTTCFKNDQGSRMPELKAALNNNNPKNLLKNKEMDEFWCPDNHLMHMDPFIHSVEPNQPNKISSELESDWIGATRNEPWWRTTDKYELASLVAQKSLEHVENCDLPRPQTKSTIGSYSDGSPTVRMSEKQYTWADVGLLSQVTDRPLSRKNDYSTASDEDNAGTQTTPDDVPSKAQLLEALCHSQTRAREAEKAAQQAYSEKEHIIKLFFKQASQLFAYKQWLQLLQLENLCLQLRNKKNQPISTLFPVTLPWFEDKGSQPKAKRGRPKGTKRKQNPPMYDISKSAVAFAVGLSLAGAGLLLGWTMGWLFPSF